jgi:hypothetical protein
LLAFEHAHVKKILIKSKSLEIIRINAVIAWEKKKMKTMKRFVTLFRTLTTLIFLKSDAIPHSLANGAFNCLFYLLVNLIVLESWNEKKRVQWYLSQSLKAAASRILKVTCLPSKFPTIKNLIKTQFQIHSHIAKFNSLTMMRLAILFNELHLLSSEKKHKDDPAWMSLP